MLLLSTACVKTPGPDDGGGYDWSVLCGPDPIVFGSNIAEPATKAPLPSDTSFGVFAFYQPGVIGGAAGAWGDGSAWTPNFMYNQEVEYDGSAYTYSPIKYWPNNPENTVTFWAYYPYDDARIDRFRQSNSSTTYSNEAHNIPDIQYTTNGHTDFLVSDPVCDQSKHAINSPVSFTFRHAMSLVDFTVRKQDPGNQFEITLTSIVIKDIYSSGVYNQQLGWIARLGDKGNLSAYTGSLATSVTPSSPIGSVIPLPQTLRFSSAKLYVTYTQKLAGDLGDAPVFENQVEIGEITHIWEKNRHYTYNITINPGNPILFTADVVVWDAEETGYYTFE